MILLAFNLKTSFAQTNCPQGDNAEGLISAPNLNPSSKFGNFDRNCIYDPKAAYAPFRIPKYEELKNNFFTQARITSGITKINGQYAGQGLTFDGANDFLINYTNSVDLTSAVGPANNGKTAIIFIDGDLTINTNQPYNSPGGGVVYVVKGNVYIQQTVTRIDAILISSGIIYTAWTGSGDSGQGYLTTNQLVINGSLISLTEDKSINFRRTLFDNRTDPAEVINQQAKYLVILKKLFSETLSISSQI